MNAKPAEPNDDPDVDPEEIADATDERIPGNAETDPLPPEVDEETEELTSWDEAPASSGTITPKVLPEDENPPAEELVRDGLEAADRDQRIAAADPDFEP
jgi:hypothetical protein